MALNPELEETLKLVAPKSWRSTNAIWARHTESQVGQTAISNRLNKLLLCGAVSVKKIGKEKHWRRV